MHFVAFQSIINYKYALSVTRSPQKEIRTVVNLGIICPRHIGFRLANTRVASG